MVVGSFFFFAGTIGALSLGCRAPDETDADAAADAALDASADAGTDSANPDAPVDADVDAPVDAAVDADVDSAVDATPDASPDAALNGPVTLRFIYNDRLESPYTLSAQIAFNSPSGALLPLQALPVAGQPGVYRAEDVPPGTTVTAAAFDAQGTFPVKLLQTIYDVKPNATYVIALFGAPAPTLVGRIRVALSPNSWASAGGCPLFAVPAGSTNYEGDITSACLQADGKVSILAETPNGSGSRTVYYALDQQLMASGVTTVSLTVNSAPRSQVVNFRSGPGEINFPGADPVASAVLFLYRKGFQYAVSSDVAGTASGSSFLGTHWSVPPTFAESGNGKGYLSYFYSQFRLAGGVTKVGSVISQTATAPTPWEVSLAGLPGLDVTQARSNLTDLTHVSVRWNPSASTYDAVASLVSWQGASGTQAWVAVGRPSSGVLAMPELPAAMASYLPAGTPSLNGPVLYHLDASWLSGASAYDQFAQAGAFVRNALDRPALLQQAGTLRFTQETPPLE